MKVETDSDSGAVVASPDLKPRHADVIEQQLDWLRGEAEIVHTQLRNIGRLFGVPAAAVAKESSTVTLRHVHRVRELVQQFQRDHDLATVRHAMFVGELVADLEATREDVCLLVNELEERAKRSRKPLPKWVAAAAKRAGEPRDWEQPD